jgi:serine/threonine-protein kinase
LGSTNGTFVAGKRIIEATVNPGEVLQLGSVKLVFEAEAPDPCAVPTTPVADRQADSQHGPKRTSLAASENPTSVEDLSLSYLTVTATGELTTLLDEAARADISQRFAPGVVIQERYKLEQELGRGGMGQVFLGRDLRLNRHVAIKVIAFNGEESGPGAPRGDELRRLFETEARIGAKLNHSALATVFDYGFYEGKPFIVFEYVEGETLQQFIERRGHIPLEEVQFIVGPIAQGLEYAHSFQIVHRDLKPANIRANEQGLFKILDLGLAKQIQLVDNWNGFAGTPAYTSPEQAAGLPVDGRADQYSLALIVYEMLTGERPFRASTAEEVLRLQREAQPPDPRSFAPDIPSNIVSALLRALHKEPSRRFGSCEALAAALGCQLIASAVDGCAILLESDVLDLSWPWRPVRQMPNHFWRRRRLALASGALWLGDGQVVEQLGVERIAALKICRGGRDLRFEATGSRSAMSRVRWQFRFPSPEDCRNWHEKLSRERQTGGPTTGALPEPQPRTIPRLLQRPDFPVQLLGQIEAEGKARLAAVQVRAAVLNADAIVAFQDEKIVGAGGTVRRATGLAARAVNAAGRAELARRAVNQQVAFSSAGFVISAVLLMAFGGWLAGPFLTSGPQGSIGIKAWYWTAYLGWPFTLLLLLSRLRWPQFLPATAFSLRALSVLPLIGHAAVLLFFVSRGNERQINAILGNPFGSLSPFGAVGLMVGVWTQVAALSRSARLAQMAEPEAPPPARAWTGRVAMAGSFLIAGILSMAVVRGGLQMAATRAGLPNAPNSVATLTGAGPRRITKNQLSDTGITWALDSTWQEVAPARQGLSHTFTFKELLSCRVTVLDTTALPRDSRGGDTELLQRVQEREFRGLVRPQRLSEPRLAQAGGIAWAELEYKAALGADPNTDYWFLLRTHSDSVRQIIVMVWCPESNRVGLGDQPREAIDGLVLGSLATARRLGPSATNANSRSSKANTGRKLAYRCRLPGVWRSDNAPPTADFDMWLWRSDGVAFAVELRDYSEPVGNGLVWLDSAEGGLLGELKKSLQDLQSTSEPVEIAGRRGRLLGLRYTNAGRLVTELRLLVFDAGWLYQVRAFTVNQHPDRAQLEQLIAGLEFPAEPTATR